MEIIAAINVIQPFPLPQCGIHLALLMPTLSGVLFVMSYRFSRNNQDLEMIGCLLGLLMSIPIACMFLIENGIPGIVGAWLYIIGMAIGAILCAALDADMADQPNI